jgi:hypothetical protein
VCTLAISSSSALAHDSEISTVVQRLGSLSSEARILLDVSERAEIHCTRFGRISEFDAPL